MIKEKAIVLTNGLLDTTNAKTCHGLLRGSERFEILAVIDYKHAGADAGEVMDGRPLNIPVFAGVEDYFGSSSGRPVYCIVGVAFSGGVLPENFRKELIDAIHRGLSIVCGLHTFLSDDPEFSRLAREKGVQLIDVRKPKPRSEYKFWSGEIYSVKTPRIAVLGTDCALGKRTTCRLLMEMCRRNGIRTEMIYTGQTGWMQGYPYGLIFDSTVNDFIGGEIERAIVACARESNPDLILLEGQSSLRNPSGPCGSEFLLSGNVKGVVLQHAPGRRFFEDTQIPIPSIESEIELIRFYGAEVSALTLNEEEMEEEAMQEYQEQMQQKLGIPVVRPLREGVEGLLPVVREFLGGRW
jgi:uncharacterized NAD-dependent epimerase/dehydratase family protein